MSPKAPSAKDFRFVVWFCRRVIFELSSARPPKEQQHRQTREDNHSAFANQFACFQSCGIRSNLTFQGSGTVRFSTLSPPPKLRAVDVADRLESEEAQLPVLRQGEVHRLTCDSVIKPGCFALRQFCSGHVQGQAKISCLQSVLNPLLQTIWIVFQLCGG